NHFRKHYLVPAEYRGERKIRGYRSPRSWLSRLNALEVFFGKKRLRAIRYQDLERFKEERLMTPVRRGEFESPRSLADCNRALQLARHLFEIARRESWIVVNPFSQGPPLISLSDEVKRLRLLSEVEETDLLRACDTHPQRAHMRVIIIAAI